MGRIAAIVVAVLVLVAILAVGFLVMSGDVIGGAYPAKNGADWLEQKGYSDDIVDAVVEGGVLQEDVIAELVGRKNADVSFLLARNPNLPRKWMDHFSSDKDDFHRSGLAQNPSLPDDLANLLMKDPSHTVWTGLARNPGLDGKTQVRVHKTTGVDLSWFTYNANMATEIEALIEEKGTAEDREALARRKKRIAGE
ncbi:MAG: hypothetical protein ACYTG4_09360 [Planctomycetota bacterium]|jgi:hypothetical protein